jgi:hypothetical protein
MSFHPLASLSPHIHCPLFRYGFSQEKRHWFFGYIAHLLLEKRLCADAQGEMGASLVSQSEEGSLFFPMILFDKKRSLYATHAPLLFSPVIDTKAVIAGETFARYPPYQP